ncbi:COP23 domain-containing protein [Anabaena sp. UHCC 0204]|uniref:COP23 domain-containing protein n=1 Tax=Anabaena sp. UHCC 0204 TaxID=2590009 RepID=UPI0020C332A2|nr:COP23 domain-containing protein [Anabaena sp. UHCC 0204]
MLSLFILNITLTGCIKSEKIIFSCEQDTNDNYVTKVRYQDKIRDLIVWKRTDFVKASFPPQRRCEEVTPKLQTAYDNGTLKHLTWGYVQDENDYNKRFKSLCTTTGKDCHTLILTLLESDDPDMELKKFTAVFYDYSKPHLSISPCKRPNDMGMNLTCDVNVLQLFDDN